MRQVNIHEAKTNLSRLIEEVEHGSMILRAKYTVIGNPANQVFVSAVSGWEISIKQSLGKLEVDKSTLLTEVEHNGFTLLPVSFQHGLVAGGLPSHHRDPFDRMLIAQAQCEGLQLISVDHCFAA